MKEKSQQQKAKDNYLKTKETFVIRVDKGKTQIINKQAEKHKKSRNTYINDLIDSDIEKTK